jgi:hypothetical protein
VFVFVLFCSGLNFPVIAPQYSFTRAMMNDFGVATPGSVKVVQAARCAYMDPAYFYECDANPADLAMFRALIEAGAKIRGHRLNLKSTDRRFSFGPPPPAWFDPGKHPDLERVEVGIERRPGDLREYWFFFSAKAQKIYIFWFAT